MLRRLPIRVPGRKSCPTDPRYSDQVPVADAIEWLLQSDEPAVRYRTRTWLLGQPESNADVKRDREQISEGRMVSALMDFASVKNVDPYRKWVGLHWRLVSLAVLMLPMDRPDMHAVLDAAIDRELSWIATVETQPFINGLYRTHATIHGNAVYAASRMGQAGDERTLQLVTHLLEWQWPDGGWNCDRRASGRRSSFHESGATAIGLASFHHAVGETDGLGSDALAAARGTAELLLEHRIFRRLADGEPIHPTFTKLHWPAYWHYDYLVGLRVLNAVDQELLRDPRTRDALDLLESQQLPDGRFKASGSWWQMSTRATAPTDVVDWGKGTRPSELLTLHARAILQSAGR
jgi:hypothetical protein